MIYCNVVDGKYNGYKVVNRIIDRKQYYSIIDSSSIIIMLYMYP